MTPEALRPTEISHQNGLEQAINRYKQSDSFLAYSENTRSVYAGDIAQFQRYCSAQDISEVRQIESENIRTWHQQLKQAGKAPATIDRKLASLSGFLNWAQAEGIIQPDSARNLPKYEPIVKKQPRVLSAEQVDLLISKAKNLRDASLISIALATGATIKEIVNLNVEDILKTEDDSTAIRFKGCVRKTQPRTLVVNKKTGNMIAKYIKSSGLKPGDPLILGFSYHKDGRLTRGGAYLILNQYGQEIGVENLNPRLLRNTFIANFAGTQHDLDVILGRKEPVRSTYSAKRLLRI